MNERIFRRGLIGLAITAVILTSMVYIFPQSARGATPTISYVSPSNGATFVDVIPGEGVNWTVNVTDSDGNLQRVRLLSNSSGSWQVFYDSGELTGTVYYHNISGINPDWTGSWKTYYWRVACYDGTWTNYTYSFTTEYVFGQPHCIVLDDLKDITTSVLYKNTTGDYYLWITQDTDDDILVKTSSLGTDFMTKSSIKACDGLYVYNAFTYNNIPYVYSIESGTGKYLTYVWYDGTAWHSGSTGLRQTYFYDGVYDDYYAYAYGADVIYYDGIYQLVYGYSYSSGYATLRYATSTNPLSSFTYISQFDSYTAVTVTRYYIPSLQILGSKLILTYKDAGYDLHWRVYDGVSWTDKGDIEADIDWQSTLRDPVNNQLVCIYINASDWLLYRVLTDPDGTWSDPVVIYKPRSGESIGYVHADYIDRRIVITFASNLRGNYNIYMICAPDYTAVTSGINITYNRIQFPDAIPNQQHVNSTVFAIKNINDRPILNITWHVGNIGDIETANNVRVWSNMSGTWQSWLVGTDHNTTKIDISAEKGSEWLPGETLYWKLEILDVGDVPEDLHANDEDIWYIVDLGT